MRTPWERNRLGLPLGTVTFAIALTVLVVLGIATATIILGSNNGEVDHNYTKQPQMTNSTIDISAEQAETSPCEVNVCYAIDASQTQSAPVYEAELKLLRSLVDETKLRSSRDSVAPTWVWTTSGNCSGAVLPPTTDLDLIDKNLQNLTGNERSRSLSRYNGLRCCQKVLDGARGTRVVVLVTGPYTQLGKEAHHHLLREGNKIRQKMQKSGVSVVTVGVYEKHQNKLQDVNFIRQIVDKTSSAFLITTADINQPSVSASIVEKICERPQSVSTELSQHDSKLSPEAWPGGECEVDVCYAIDSSRPDSFQAGLSVAWNLSRAISESALDPWVGLTPFSPKFSVFTNTRRLGRENVIVRQTQDVVGFRRIVSTRGENYRSPSTDWLSGMAGCLTTLDDTSRQKVAIALVPRQAKIGRSSERRLASAKSAFASKGITIMTVALPSSEGRSKNMTKLLKNFATDEQYFFELSRSNANGRKELEAAIRRISGSVCTLKSPIPERKARSSSIGVDTTCQCSRLHISGLPGDCFDHVEDGLCVSRECSSNQRYRCDYDGEEICNARGVDRFVWKCNGVLNRTHCPCGREPVVVVKPIDPGGSSVPRYVAAPAVEG